jgi:ribosomal protein S18 acetylase RimI-like enzyme
MTGAALFAGPGFGALEAGAQEIPALQRFFEENPEYFLAVSGEGPHAGPAQEEFEDRPPPDCPWDGKWMIRFVDADGAIVALADVVSNLLAPGVWHVGLFIVATRLHGSGRASEAFDALEGWIRDGGAQWLRLNVAVGNTRAERFWERTGFAEVRRREGVRIGRQDNTMRVMLKPLAGGSLADYLARVPRDRPESS